MKGTPYLYRIRNKVKLYEKAYGKRPKQILLSYWYFDKLMKEVERNTYFTAMDNIKTVFGIPIKVLPREKIPSYKHIFLLPATEG